MGPKNGSSHPHGMRPHGFHFVLPALAAYSAAEVEPGWEAVLRLAAAEGVAGRWERAIPLLEATREVAQARGQATWAARMQTALVWQWLERVAYQSRGHREAAQREWARAESMVGVVRNNPDLAAEWEDLQGWRIYVDAQETDGFKRALNHFETALRQSTPPALRARLLFHRGLALQQLERHEASEPPFREALALAERNQDLVMQAFCLRHLGYLAAVRDLPAEALALQRRALALRQQAGHAVGIAFGSGTVADLLLDRPGSRTEVLHLYAQFLRVAKSIGSHRGIASANEKLGRALAHTEPARARRHLHESIQHFHWFGDPQAAARVEALLPSLTGAPPPVR